MALVRTPTAGAQAAAAATVVGHEANNSPTPPQTRASARDSPTAMGALAAGEVGGKQKKHGKNGKHSSTESTSRGGKKMSKAAKT